MTGFDRSVPNVARIYNALLGGKDNYASDREAAERILKIEPDSARVARQNRAFLGRVVRCATRSHSGSRRGSGGTARPLA
jgi:hypothetical protein